MDSGRQIRIYAIFSSLPEVPNKHKTVKKKKFRKTSNPIVLSTKMYTKCNNILKICTSKLNNCIGQMSNLQCLIDINLLASPLALFPIRRVILYSDIIN